MTPKWTIEYNNDTGPSDESYSQWWTVTDGDRRFRTYSEDDAGWLATLLNAQP